MGSRLLARGPGRPGRAGERATDHDGLRRDPQRPDLILTPMFRRVVPLRSSWLSALGAALAQQPASHSSAREGPDAVRLRAGSTRRPPRPREALRRRAQGREPAHLDAPARRPPAPPRLAVRQGQRRVHRRPVPLVGLRGRDRPSTRCCSRRRRCGSVELVAPTKFVASLDRAGAEGGRDLGPDGRAAADLQRLLGRRRRDRASSSTSTTACRPTTRSSSAAASTCKGKIVIARYGGSWRGIKPKVAAEHGAVGCLIYSDPREDGYFAGRRLPEGRLAQRPRRPARLGRGHADLSRRSADARRRRDQGRQAPRRSRKRATLTKIPVLPISYADAQPLLKALGGPVAPAAWRGALPITYHIGPGPARVHLKLQFDWKLAPAYNVIATLQGSELPDQWIVRGNHHDAWVNGARRSGQRHGRADGGGARDRRAGEGRLEAEAHASSSRPGTARSRALLGSTEWVEDHAEELAAQGGRLHQLRHATAAASSTSAARTASSGSSTRCARGRLGSGQGRHGRRSR